jgi:hypothetical protein
MATLKEFLSELAIDPTKLGKFIHDPEASMKEAEINVEDQAVLKSRFANIIYARLAGLPIEKAFAIATHSGEVDPEEAYYPVMGMDSVKSMPVRPYFLPPLPPPPPPPPYWNYYYPYYTPYSYFNWMPQYQMPQYQMPHYQWSPFSHFPFKPWV